MRHVQYIVAALAIGAISGGCAMLHHDDYAGRGAMMGATAGAVIGHQYGNGGRDKGALIGGVLGYTAGLFYEQNEREINSRQPNGGAYYQPGPRQGHGHGRGVGYQPYGGYYYPYPDDGYYYGPRR